MTSAVYGIAGSTNQAAEIVGRLKTEGFTERDISVLMPDKGDTKAFAKDNQTKAPQGAATGAGAGGVIGGTLGLLAGIGALAIPGVGPFIAAGPIMATLSGAAVGATVGGLTGALIGLGIPEDDAHRYEERLNSGGILISIHAQSPDQASRARQILEDEGAEDITGPVDVTSTTTTTRMP